MCVFVLAEKHRGFAFVEFEFAEDAAAAMDNMVIFLKNTFSHCSVTVKLHMFTMH